MALHGIAISFWAFKACNIRAINLLIAMSASSSATGAAAGAAAETAYGIIELIAVGRKFEYQGYGKHPGDSEKGGLTQGPGFT